MTLPEWWEPFEQFMARHHPNERPDTTKWKELRLVFALGWRESRPPRVWAALATMFDRVRSVTLEHTNGEVVVQVRSPQETDERVLVETAASLEDAVTRLSRRVGSSDEES